MGKRNASKRDAKKAKREALRPAPKKVEVVMTTAYLVLMVDGDEREVVEEGKALSLEAAVELVDQVFAREGDEGEWEIMTCRGTLLYGQIAEL